MMLNRVVLICLPTPRVIAMADLKVKAGIF